METIPTIRLLVTSRIKLNLPQECVFTLAPLPQDDAVALFVNRAHLARAQFAFTEENQATIAELCHRLDGLPLSIELAAARAAILTPEQILERLKRRFDLLSDQRRDREERHRSLRATLDWGWGLLSPDVQRFFAQLCVFRGSFSLEAAEAVTGEFLAIDYLQYLADASFLLVDNHEGHQRFRLLETLREYGQEKWDKETDGTLTQRHGAYFLERARYGSKRLGRETYADSMTLFKQDQDNFAAALDAFVVSEPVQAVELCRQLADFWSNAYLKREAMHYLTRTLEAVQEGYKRVELSNTQWALLHSDLANAHQDLHDFERSHQHFRASLTYHDKQVRSTVADEEAHRIARRRRAGALHNFANTLFHEKRFEEAQGYYAEAAALNRAMGNQTWLANNLNGLCHIAGRQAFAADTVERRALLLEQGLTCAQEAVEICRALRQEHLLGFMLAAQSETLIGLERYSHALTAVTEGFALAVLLENWEIVAELLTHYHHIAFHNANCERAAQFIGAATGIGERYQIIDTNTDDNSYTSITDKRREILRDALGQQKYDALYAQGFQAGSSLDLETLHRLVAI